MIVYDGRHRGHRAAIGPTVKTHRPDSCRLAAWTALLDAHSRLTGRLEAELEQSHGISLAQYEVLYRLNDAPGGRLRLNELTSHARMTKSGVSRLVDRMSEGGLIGTERCPSDRRGAFAVLTPQGRAVLRRAAALHLRGVQDNFGSLIDDDEATALRVALERVRDALPAAGCRGSRSAAAETLSG
jgi:DNA-binding MarR family transcriptional regulator